MWAASIFCRHTLGYVGRSIYPVFTYPELLKWARRQARCDPKYERIFKGKRYVPLKKRATPQDLDLVLEWELESFGEENGRRDYVRLTPQEIARMEPVPQWFPDPLEPRPWLSWSDCHVIDCIADPDLYLRWLENLPFSEWLDREDISVWLGGGESTVDC